MVTPEPVTVKSRSVEAEVEPRLRLPLTMSPRKERPPVEPVKTRLAASAEEAPMPLASPPSARKSTVTRPVPPMVVTPV
jgi:hypothetical protein